MLLWRIIQERRAETVLRKAKKKEERICFNEMHEMGVVLQRSDDVVNRYTSVKFAGVNLFYISTEFDQHY